MENRFLFAELFSAESVGYRYYFGNRGGVCRFLKKNWEKYGFTKVKKVIPGGKERYDSVYEGLLSCENSDFVLIHDGARPFITQEILERGMTGIRETGACDRNALERYC